MATVIQIKRSANVAAPSTSDLVEAELAYSQDKSNDGAGAILYIESLDSGDSAVIHKIGGKYYTDIIDTATNNNTANKLVKRDSAGSFSANVITANSFVGNIIGTIDGVAGSAVIANTANTLTTARTIQLTGDVTGSVSFDGSQNVSISTTVAADSVALGTDTTGNYVQSITGGTGVTVTGGTGEGSTPSVAIGQAVGTTDNVTFNSVTAALYGNANTATRLATTRYINLSGDASGTAAFDGTGNADITVTVQNNSVALGTDTTGDYVGNVTAGTGITTTGTVGEGWSVAVGLDTSGVTASTYGGASKVPVITVDTYGRITSAANVSVAGVTNFAASGNTFTISTADGGTFSASIQPDSVELGRDTTGNYMSAVSAGAGISVTHTPSEGSTATIALGTSGVSAATYGSATNVSQVVVDQYGRVTSASNVTIAIPSSALTTDVALGTQTSGNYVAGLTAGTGISITGSGSEGATPTITNDGVTSISGTSNQITASAGTGAITLSLPNAITTPGSLTVTGDLIVNGTALTVNTATVTVDDPLVKFGNANPADSLDIGFFGGYTSSGEKFAGLFRDASDSGKFKLFVDLTTDPTTNVINTANYTVATLVSNLTGGTVSGLTSAIAVADGGTGANTFTTNGVLYGQGTSALAVATGSAGQVLQLNGSGVPVFGVLDGGTY